MLNGEEEEEEEEDADLSGELCLCLFCSSEQASAATTLDHCKTEHDIDLLLLVATKLGRARPVVCQCDSIIHIIISLLCRS